MTLILVLRAMLWRVPRTVEVTGPAVAVRTRRLPFYVHIWGFLLPPWPNYGVPRLRAASRRRSRR
jgi:hypothetical protein